MKLLEIAGVDPDETEHVIQQSFNDRVVSDLLADKSTTPEVDATQVIQQLIKKFPQITAHAKFSISKTATRIRIMFRENDTVISIPPKLHSELGEILVLHELAHLLYTKDLLTNKIVKYRNAGQAFTVLRVLEDVAIERKLERDFPGTVEIFKRRSPHAISSITSHQSSKFADDVNQLFLTLRGYTTRKFGGSTEALKLAETYLRSTDDEDKIDAVLRIAEILSH